MSDPVLLLFAGLVIGIVCVMYWRVIAAVLVVAVVAVFTVGVIDVVRAVQELTP